MLEKLRFAMDRLEERLWARPLILCVMSIISVVGAQYTDRIETSLIVPEISASSIVQLLSVLSSGMLVISTFAVASMIAAYTSASNSATPRSFPLIVSDDVSKNALSVFIGAFIFSVISSTMFQNSAFGDQGTFVLFLMIVVTFAVVIVVFVRWVDSIARLGRMASTIDKIEDACLKAMLHYQDQPAMGGRLIDNVSTQGIAVISDEIGYVQHIDMPSLQEFAEKQNLVLQINARPGCFATATKPLVYITDASAKSETIDYQPVKDSFIIGNERKFNCDPRFGLVALSEIAGRALSPGINDPGTAISIISTFVRLFSHWSDILDKRSSEVKFERLQMMALSTHDMFDDAFSAASRDGAGFLEVGIRLQKALRSLASLGNQDMFDSANYFSNMALKKSLSQLDYENERRIISELADWHTTARTELDALHFGLGTKK